jgi:hypothetical protein
VWLIVGTECTYGTGGPIRVSRSVSSFNASFLFRISWY